MIVKFHARGKGGGSGPVDYLLGRERNREGARVLRGDPEEVRELIDATPFAKKYTSGVLSFAEQTLPPGERERVMESFERVLMPGLEKNQYSILWVEHQDKGRLELNFVIPNMELVSGKRLQPYYDRADRPRINAWQTLVNHHYGLHDPNAPENRRTLVTPNNCVFRSIRSRIGIEVRSAIRIHSINRELNFFYRFLTRFFAAFHYRGIFPQ